MEQTTHSDGIPGNITVEKKTLNGFLICPPFSAEM
jgi:hypothetical protein